MDLTPRQVVTQFAHVLQLDLFPMLEATVGPLSTQLQLLAATMAMVPLERFLSSRRASTGRPPKDRAALATAFIAKAILNLPTTRALMSRLCVDAGLRQFCGWSNAESVPDETKFSRAFAEFAISELPQQLHAAPSRRHPRQPRPSHHLDRLQWHRPRHDQLSRRRVPAMQWRRHAHRTESGAVSVSACRRQCSPRSRSPSHRGRRFVCHLIALPRLRQKDRPVWHCASRVFTRLRL